MPSPAMATVRPSACRRLTASAFWSGRTSASTRSMPSRRATASAVVRLSPVIITSSMPSSWSWRIASGVLSLTGSATPRRPATTPSSATNMTVWPSLRSSSALFAGDSDGAARSSTRARLPTTTARPPTRPAMLLPVTDSKPSASSRSMPRSSAPWTMAAPSGCSLERSSEAARRRNEVSSSSPSGVTLASRGRPSVRVNMFRFQVRTDRQNRSKNGQAPHSTTGVARASSTMSRPLEPASQSNEAPGRWRPMARTTNGAVSSALTQRRRRMSTSS